MDDPSSSIQHAQFLQAAVGIQAGFGVLVLTVAGRWIGGVWTTMLATLAAVLLAFNPLVNTSLFSNLTTDRLQMMLVALIPFTLILIAISFKPVPVFVHLLVALLGLGSLLALVFHSYGVQPEMTPVEIHQLHTSLYLHRIVPISLAVLVFWGLLEPIAVRSPGVAAPMVVTLLAVGCTLVLMLSAENNAGLMATPVAGSAGGAAMAALMMMSAPGRLKYNCSLARGPMLLWLSILGSLFAFLWISTDQLPRTGLLCLALVPVVAWIPEIGAIHRLKSWQRESIRLVLVAIPVVTGMSLAFREHQREAAAAGDPFGLVWPATAQPAAPILPSQIPIPKTINPPTMT